MMTLCPYNIRYSVRTNDDDDEGGDSFVCAQFAARFVMS